MIFRVWSRTGGMLLALTLTLVSLTTSSQDSALMKREGWITGDCAETWEFASRAYARESDQLLYSEQHRQCRDADGKPLRGEIEYFDPDGQLVGYKWLDYSPGSVAPDFELVNQMANYREGARRSAGKIELSRMDPGKSLESRKISVPRGDFVIDSGFDEFVRQKLDVLRRGDTLRLTLVVPGRLDSYKFRAGKFEEVERMGRRAWKIIVEHDSMLVRFLVDPITLYYDAETRRLLEFQGISNIAGADGENFDARIEYLPDSWKITSAQESRGI